MPGIQASLLRDLRVVLLEIEAFDSDGSLRALFTTDQLRPFRDNLPETRSRSERIDSTIAYLADKTHSNTGENGLLLLLQTLRDRIDPGDARYQRLEQLSLRIETALSQAHDQSATGNAALLQNLLHGGPDSIAAQPAGARTWLPHGLIWSAISFAIAMVAMLALATPLRCVLEYRLTETIVTLLITLSGGAFVLFRNLLPQSVRTSAQSAYGGVAASLLLGIVVAIALPKVAEAKCQAITGTVPQAFPAAAAGETLLIVVPFAGRLNDISAFPERYVRDALTKGIARISQGDQPLRLEMWANPVANQRDAREIGANYGATLVIWGEFDDVGGVRTFIEIMRDVPQADVQIDGNWLTLGTLAPSQTDAGQLTRDCLMKALPAQSDSLTAVALGMIQLVHGRRADAETLFTQAIEAAPSVPGCGAEVQAAYYWRGFARSLLEEYSAALDDLNHALALHKDYTLAQTQRGVVQIAIGRVDAAQADFQAALAQISPADKTARGALLGNVGLTQELSGELNQALESYRQADQLVQASGDKFAQAISAGHLGSLFLRTGDLDQALRYHTQALEICRTLGYKRGEAVALGNLGLIEYRRKDLDAALKHFNDALEIDQASGSTTGQGQELVWIGVIQLEHNQPVQARDSFERANKLFETTGSLAGQGRAYIGIALVEYQQGSTNATAAALRQALDLLEQIGSPDAAKVRQQLQRLQP